VANEGTYHAQFQFHGRLAQPIAQLTRNEIPGWLEKHPDGVLVMYVKQKNAETRSLFRQPYRGGQAALMNADQARAYLTVKLE
jgi:hypothetical protein